MRSILDLDTVFDTRRYIISLGLQEACVAVTVLSGWQVHFKWYQPWKGALSKKKRKEKVSMLLASLRKSSLPVTFWLGFPTLPSADSHHTLPLSPTFILARLSLLELPRHSAGLVEGIIGGRADTETLGASGALHSETSVPVIGV